MKTKLFRKICVICLILAFVLSFPQAVYAEETDLTEDILAEIRSRLDQALLAGERWVDLADMNIIVNMYSDRYQSALSPRIKKCGYLISTAAKMMLQQRSAIPKEDGSVISFLNLLLSINGFL